MAASALVVLGVGIYFVHHSVESAASSVQVAATGNTCATSAVRLSGVLEDCLSGVGGISCPSGSFDHDRVFRYRGATDQFVLYVEVNGAYHGPATYPLAPWPDASLGAPDGVAKVALRRWTDGMLWRSTTGWLTIDPDEESGWVYAGMQVAGDQTSGPAIRALSTNRPVNAALGVQLSIAGPWSCA
jgi:hypothetical protein